MPLIQASVGGHAVFISNPRAFAAVESESQGGDAAGEGAEGDGDADDGEGAGDGAEEGAGDGAGAGNEAQYPLWARCGSGSGARTACLGVALLFHGCSHDASIWRDGPPERIVVGELLRQRILAVAFSSAAALDADPSNRGCWDVMTQPESKENADMQRAVEIAAEVAAVLNPPAPTSAGDATLAVGGLDAAAFAGFFPATHFPPVQPALRVPLLGLGTSSGAAFASLLALHLQLEAVVLYVAATGRGATLSLLHPTQTQGQGQTQGQVPSSVPAPPAWLGLGVLQDPAFPGDRLSPFYRPLDAAGAPPGGAGGNGKRRPIAGLAATRYPSVVFVPMTRDAGSVRRVRADAQALLALGYLDGAILGVGDSLAGGKADKKARRVADAAGADAADVESESVDDGATEDGVGDAEGASGGGSSPSVSTQYQRWVFEFPVDPRPLMPMTLHEAMPSRLTERASRELYATLLARRALDVGRRGGAARGLRSGQQGDGLVAAGATEADAVDLAGNLAGEFAGDLAGEFAVEPRVGTVGGPLHLLYDGREEPLHSAVAAFVASLQPASSLADTVVDLSYCGAPGRPTFFCYPQDVPWDFPPAANASAVGAALTDADGDGGSGVEVVLIEEGQALPPTADDGPANEAGPGSTVAAAARELVHAAVDEVLNDLFARHEMTAMHAESIVDVLATLIDSTGARRR
jgi:hypothetical protein